MKKEELYKRIMEKVSAKLKNVLNEDFQFDDTEVADKILEIITRDKQLLNIVQNASIDDWSSLIRGMYKLVKSGNIPENPEKIANIVQLAAAIIQRGLDSKLQEKMKEMTNEDFQYTAKFLMTEVRKKAGNNPNPKDSNNAEKPLSDSKKANEGEVCDKCGKNPCQCEGKQCEGKQCEGKQCEGKQCEGKQCDENKKVTEARHYRAKGGFSKYLVENHIRPGRK